MNDYVQITFSNLQPEQEDMLIAHLAEAGYEGFEENENGLKAFIPETDYDDLLLHELVYKYQLSFNKKIIAEQNWNKLWESNFEPVIIGGFVAVRAGFHPPVENVQHEIIITPKMSFGTGHHATTYMMMETMMKIDCKNKSVLDFGTGTGVLAIFAEKLGAKQITAIDNDEWSITNAAENFKENSCREISLLQADFVPENQKYDLILANINKNVIIGQFSPLIHSMENTGTLLISGLLAEDKQEIIKIAGQHQLKLEGENMQNGWICLKFNF
jgi:ribosomal protein L11 methyltransferase